LAGGLKDGLHAADRMKTSQAHVAIKRIDLNSKTAPASPLGCNTDPKPRNLPMQRRGTLRAAPTHAGYLLAMRRFRRPMPQSLQLISGNPSIVARSLCVKLMRLAAASTSAAAKVTSRDCILRSGHARRLLSLNSGSVRNLFKNISCSMNFSGGSVSGTTRKPRPSLPGSGIILAR